MDAYKKYALQIADNALILSHRLSENCSKGPYLEEDLAGTNIALDLIGIAETILEEIAQKEGPGITGDDLAFKREECDYFNCLLVEQPNNDFAFIMVRQFFADAFNFYFFSALTKSADNFLSQMAMKSLKQITYHLRRSSEWMLRLGDGTKEANKKTQNAIDTLWKFTPELFTPNATDNLMNITKIGCDLNEVKGNWNQKVREILYMANLKVPTNNYTVLGGKDGVHTEYFGHILSEMQYLPTKYPDAKW